MPNDALKQAVLVAIGRSPVGKASKGSLRHLRPDDLAAQVVQGVLQRAQPLRGEQVDDVILGCAMPEAEQGLNIARIATLRAGLPDETSAMTINRFCSSGLQAIALAAYSICCGMNEVVLAGGVESMSLMPREGHHFSPNPILAESDPDVYLSMGLTAENLAQKYDIGRAQQDEFSLASHVKACAAQEAGRFDRELVSLEISLEEVSENGKESRQIWLRADEGPRPDTSLEALAQLQPVFQAQGTVTAGNSSQRSDGAALALLTSRRKAKELGLAPAGSLVSYATAGVAPEIMGIGPVSAIPKALQAAGLELKDIGLIELNEAFAVQALAVIQEAGLDPRIVNVNGGAIALGHPLGCTGAKLTATILSEMERRSVRYGLVTMCIGGGMGAAGVIECYRV